jgi:hypothetical protein
MVVFSESIGRSWPENYPSIALTIDAVNIPEGLDAVEKQNLESLFRG